MKMGHFRALAVAGAMLLAGSSWAQSVTLNLDGNVDDLMTSSFQSNGSFYQVGDFALSSFDFPLILNQGDSVFATVTLNRPFTAPASPNQSVIVDFGFSSGPPSFEDPGDVVISSDMEFFLAGASVYSTGNACSNCLSAVAGRSPGDAFSFDRIEISFDVLNLTEPFTVNGVSLGYQLAQPVPEPAAWALWAGGLGALSLWTRRRKATVARDKASI